jgi:16S rRNA (cytosine1402-N4)-methyltransferase
VDRPQHVPVLLREVLERLDPRPGNLVVDATLGLGGHAVEILGRLAPGGRLVGIDRDPRAIEFARERLRAAGGDVVLHHGRFSGIGEALRAAGVPPERSAHGILFDLGVSSYQLDTAARGFGFGREGPLDMRMDPERGETAAQLLERLSIDEISEIIRTFGEEPAARRIARAIDRRRREGKLLTTGDLARAVEEVLPRGGRRIHPATRTFQAVRIAVNDELADLRSALLDVDRYLTPGGRVVVVSYHSLEDRIAKSILREREREGILEVDRPNPLVPGSEEVQVNPRARSARLRSARRRA